MYLGSPGMPMFPALNFYPDRAIWMQSFAWDFQESRSPAGAGCWKYKTNSHCALSQACQVVTLWVHNSLCVHTVDLLPLQCILDAPILLSFPRMLLFLFSSSTNLYLYFHKLPVRLHWCLRSKLCPGVQSQNWTLEFQTLRPTVAP